MKDTIKWGNIWGNVYYRIDGKYDWYAGCVVQENRTTYDIVVDAGHEKTQIRVIRIKKARFHAA